MAIPSTPAMLARQVVERLAAGGGPPQGGPGGPSPLGPGAAAITNARPGGSMAGDQVASQLAELQGADPNAILNMLKQQKSIAVAIYVRTAFTMPGVSRNMAQMQKYIDNAIKEAEQGAATNQAVSPIANNASIPNPQGGNESGPGMGLQQFVQGA